jgi:hypothetical protein
MTTEQALNVAQVLVVQNFRMAERISGQDVHGVHLDEAHDGDVDSNFCLGVR